MYIIAELQTNNGSTTVVQPLPKEYDRNTADNKFFTTAAYAAISSVQRHAVSMFTNEGFPINNKYYDHGVN